MRVPKSPSLAVGQTRRLGRAPLLLRHLGASPAQLQQIRPPPSAPRPVYAGPGGFPLRRHSADLLSAPARSRQAQTPSLVAVMRKLLHAIFGMLRHQQPYSGSLLCPRFARPYDSKQERFSSTSPEKKTLANQERISVSAQNRSAVRIGSYISSSCCNKTKRAA